MNQRAAQAELLLHAAGELAYGARQERIQAGAVSQFVDAPPAFGGRMAEQAAEELQVLLDRERGVEVLAQTLGHVGDVGAHSIAVTGTRHIAAQHLHTALLHLPGAG